MAKRLIDWTVKDSTLTMGEYVDSENPSIPLENFDIEKLYPEFSKFNKVQMFLIVYGLKQKLADKGSATKDASEKASLAKELWEVFLEGKTGTARVNATGAKENKAFVQNMKKNSEVISLDGLQTKKICFPDLFTEEDEKKLQEFYKMMWKSSKKEK